MADSFPWWRKTTASSWILRLYSLEYSSIPKPVSSSQPTRVCFSFTDDKTEDRKPHKPAGVSCSLQSLTAIDFHPDVRRHGCIYNLQLYVTSTKYFGAPEKGGALIKIAVIPKWKMRYIIIWLHLSDHSTKKKHFNQFFILVHLQSPSTKCLSALIKTYHIISFNSRIKCLNNFCHFILNKLWLLIIFCFCAGLFYLTFQQ